jgi:hypothetical protein
MTLNNTLHLVSRITELEIENARLQAELDELRKHISKPDTEPEPLFTRAHWQVLKDDPSLCYAGWFDGELWVVVCETGRCVIRYTGESVWQVAIEASFDDLVLQAKLQEVADYLDLAKPVKYSRVRYGRD